MAELEQERSLAHTLDEQVQALLHPHMLCYHGPNTMDHLTSFSIDTVLQELRTNAPDVMELLSTLARTGRFEEGDADDQHAHTATLRTVTSLCTLLKARSVKVLGLQLLLTFMLIARATSKQVGSTQHACH